MKGERILKNELIKYKVKNDIIFSYIFSKEDILKEFLQAILNCNIEKVHLLPYNYNINKRFLQCAFWLKLFFFNCAEYLLRLCDKNGYPGLLPKIAV